MERQARFFFGSFQIIILLMSALLAAAACGCAQSTGFQPAEQYSFVPTCEPVVDEPVPGGRFRLYAGGASVPLLRLKCVQFDEGDMVIVGHDGGVLWHGFVGAIDGPVLVDYANASKGEITLTDCTYDPRANENPEATPFCRKSLSIGRNRIVETKPILVLTPERYDERRVAELVDAANRSLAACDNEDYVEPLAHLRNIGIGCPEKIWEAFNRVKAGNNCHGSEELHFFSGEVWCAAELMGVKLPD